MAQATGFRVVLLFEEVLDAQAERASKADTGQHLESIRGNHGETMGKPWGNHGETMGKSQKIRPNFVGSDISRTVEKKTPQKLRRVDS